MTKHSHLIDGKFQSDKYPTCPLGKVPLSCEDTMAQDLLWEYGERRREVDANFTTDLHQALLNAGYKPKAAIEKPRAFFFGCWNDAGHYLHNPDGSTAYQVDDEFRRKIGHSFDGTFAPREMNQRVLWLAQYKPGEFSRFDSRSSERSQGQFLCHKVAGFTMISWWDRTQGDTRSGCNSNFLLEGDHNAQTMVHKLKVYFPHVVHNLKEASIELVDITLHEAIESRS